MTINLQSIIQRTANMVATNIDGEIVMMSIDKGEYYGLDEVASRIWELIEVQTSVETLVGQLLEEFEVDRITCEVDTLEFLNQLLEKNLLIVK